jgi:alpha-galactosidase
MRVVLIFSLLVAALSAKNTVKVFILAGQSNIEGKAQNKLLEYQATAPNTKKHFAHLREDGKWIERDDVMIKYLNRHGRLTIGYGSRDRTGVELQLGHTLGDHYEEPVLLIKTAWGGHSLYQKFRPPSAGLRSAEKLAGELEKARERTRKNNEKRKKNDPLPTMEDIKAGYGVSWREMLKEVRETLENYETLFPSLKGATPEIAGFVWFQGWNDQYNGAETEYASNMTHFIKDVRKEFESPEMPFVIGVMGQNGSKEAKGAMKVIQDAQTAMEKLPKVKAVRTDVLIDKAAEALYPTWRENIPEWEKVGSDHGYHYLGSAIWFNRIGKGFAEALLELE